MVNIDFVPGTVTAVVLVIVVTVLFYWYSTQNFDYWSKRNIPFVKPIPFLGSIYDYSKRPIHEVDEERYKKYGCVHGTFEGTRPFLVVGDPVLLRDILVKDFHIFPNRRPLSCGDPAMDKILTFVTGEDWKRLRTIITPTFSTGKIKRMMGIFKECSETAVQNFAKAAQNGEPVELKRILGAFSMDVIASAAFSTKLDSHNDPENEFVQMAAKIFRQKVNWRVLVYFLFPNFVKLMGIPIFPPKGINFFCQVTLNIIAQRKKTGQTRNDFLQLLMDTAKELSDDSKSELKEKEAEDLAFTYGGVFPDHLVFKDVKKKELSVDELVAQCILFFLSGYDTTASTLSLVVYNLALHQDIQERVYKELADAIQETNGVLTYEALQSMKDMDNVISETLRLYPPAVRTERQAAIDYRLGETGITVPAGMVICIPVYAMHKDPKFFPDPEKFDPDRFKLNERSKREQYAYLPFGAGPRNCLGMRFALMEIKVCLAHVLASYRFSKSPQTQVPLEFLIGQGTLQAKEIYVSVETRRDNPFNK